MSASLLEPISIKSSFNTQKENYICQLEAKINLFNETISYQIWRKGNNESRDQLTIVLSDNQLFVIESDIRKKFAQLSFTDRARILACLPLADISTEEWDPSKMKITLIFQKVLTEYTIYASAKEGGLAEPFSIQKSYSYLTNETSWVFTNGKSFGAFVNQSRHVREKSTEQLQELKKISDLV